MSAVVTQGVARIQHADTGDIYEIAPDELDWEEVGADERQMGPEIAYAAEIDHPELGNLSWQLWEYPVGMENYQDVDVGRHTLLENFSISLGAGSLDEPDEDEDEEDPEGFRSKVDALVEWFQERYEDPAHRTPHETSEGGYIWIWGGPYDAREVLSDNFPEDEAAVEAAVKKIESEGNFEWTLTPQYDFDPDDAEPIEPAGDRLDDDVPDDDRTDAELETALLLALREVPGPQPGPRFEVDAAGRIELMGWQDGERAAAPPLGLGPEIREAAQELVTSLEGTNGHPELLAEARRYVAAVTGNGLTIEQLYARGVRLENADFALAADIRAGDRPPLPSGTRAALKSVLHLHAAAIMINPEGARLVAAAAAYSRPSGDTADAQAAARELSDAAQLAGSLIGPSAQAAVAEAASTLASGPNPERSTQVSMGVLSGLVAAIAKLHGEATKGIVGKFVWEALKNTVVVSALVHTTTVGLDQAFSFLLGQAPHLQTLAAILFPDHHWMNVLANALMAIRRRLQVRGPR